MTNLNKLIKGLSVFLLYILVPYVIDMFLPSITKSTNLELLYRFIFMFLLLLFYIFIYKDDIIKDIKAFKESPLKIIKKSGLYFLILMVGFFATSSILLLIFPDFTYTNSGIIDTLLKDNFLLMIFYVFIITLFTETIVFRKVFKDIINNKYFFIIFSGLIYGIFQVGYSVTGLNDILTMIPFVVAGMTLSASYENTDNILTPCFVYLLYNLFSLIITI